MSRIAFLGLGAMGSRMALNLIKAGHQVTVWNRTPAAMAPLVEAGAKPAASPRAAADGAGFVFAMVTDDEAARAVWLDEETGAAEAMSPGAIAIESSTVTPGFIRELGAGFAARGLSLIDAPVAGSRPQAEAGQLIFMAGGDADALDRARPVLAALAANILHVGPVGQGAVLKLAVNSYFAAQLTIMAELLGFLSRNGFETTQAAELMGQFPVVPAPLAGAARMMAAGNTAPLFTIDMLAKDLGYALATGEGAGAAMPSVAHNLALFRKAQALGKGASNITGLAALFS